MWHCADWRNLERMEHIVNIETIFEYRVYSDAFSAYVVKLDDQRKIVKRFRGETAWSDAERWAWDAHYARSA